MCGIFVNIFRIFKKKNSSQYRFYYDKLPAYHIVVYYITKLENNFYEKIVIDFSLKLYLFIVCKVEAFKLNRNCKSIDI